MNTAHSPQFSQCPCECICSWPLLAGPIADPDTAGSDTADHDHTSTRDPSAATTAKRLQHLIAASDNPLETKPDPLLFARPYDSDNTNDSGPAALELACPPGQCFDEEMVIMSNARWIELYTGTSHQLEYSTSCAGEQVDGDIHVAFVPTEGATHVRLKLVSLPKHQPNVLKLHLLQVSTKPAPSAPSPITPLPLDLPPNLSALVGLMSLLPASSQAQAQHHPTNDLSSLSRDTTTTSMLAAAAATPDQPAIEPLTAAAPGSTQTEASHWDRLFDRLDAFEARVVDSFAQVNERMGTLEERMAALELHVAHHSDPPSPRLPPA